VVAELCFDGLPASELWTRSDPVGNVRGNAPNYFAVNGAGDAVLQLQIHLRDGVLGEDGGIGDITCGTDTRISL